MKRRFIAAAPCAAALLAVALTVSSCASRPPEPEVPAQREEEPPPLPLPVSRNLADPGIKTAEQLTRFFMDAHPEADAAFVREMADCYVAEAAEEGINSDCAFVQMCLETGYLRFGNLVTPDMHNYCGLGAIDAEHPGERFATMQDGVRAHIQHLHAYATTAEFQLHNALLDNRYKWVQPRGKAPSVFDLAGTWAADRDYGFKLDALLSRLEEY